MRLRYSLLMIGLCGAFRLLGISSELSVSLKKSVLLKDIRNEELSWTRRYESFDSLLSLIPETPGKSPVSNGEIARVAIYLGHEAETGMNYRDAASLYRRAYKYFGDNEVNEKLLAALGVGKMEFRQYGYKEAIKWNSIVLNVDKSDSLCWMDIEACAELSGVASRYKLFNLSAALLNEMELSLEKLQKSDASDERKGFGRARYLISKGNLLLDQKKFMEALRQYEDALECSRDTDIYFMAHNNIGFLSFLNGEYALALPYFKAVLKTRNSQQIVAAINLCSSYIHLQMPDSAEMIYRTFLRNGAVNEESGLAHFPPLLMSYISKLRKDYPTAFDYYEESFNLLNNSFEPRDSIVGADIEKAIRDAADSRLRKPWYEIGGAETAYTFIGIVLICMCIILELALLRSRRRRYAIQNRLWSKDYDLLLADSREMRITSDLCLEKNRLDNAIVENIRLRELITTIMDKAEGDKVSSNLRVEILTLAKNMNLGTSTLNERLRLHEQVEHDFLQRLYEAHPDLTNAEREICAYASMGLTPKDVAAATNRSIKTVNTLRHRVRTKLALPPELTIEAYLLRLSR